MIAVFSWLLSPEHIELEVNYSSSPRDIPVEAQDSGRYVQNNLNVRKEFRFYLDSAFRQALDNNVPFVYTVGTAYNDDVYTDKEHGVMIGKFYLVIDSKLLLDSTGSTKIKIFR